jgi:hypothetical protein
MQMEKEFFYTITIHRTPTSGKCGKEHNVTFKGNIKVDDNIKNTNDIYELLIERHKNTFYDEVIVDWTINPKVVFNDYFYIITWNDGQDIQTKTGIEKGSSRDEIFTRVKNSCVCIPNYTPRIHFWSLEKNVL